MAGIVDKTMFLVYNIFIVKSLFVSTCKSGRISGLKQAVKIEKAKSMFKNLFKNAITIPNFLTLLRFVFLVVFMVLYIGADNKSQEYTATFFLAIGFLTDFFDGFIARRFNMISDLGKALDPIADKLSHGIIMLCLCTKHKLMIMLVAILVIKEGFMAVMGIRNFKRGIVNSAKWFGKICTAILFVALIVLLVLPLSKAAANTIIIICAIVMMWSLIMYIRFFYLENKEMGNSEK